MYAAFIVAHLDAINSSSSLSGAVPMPILTGKKQFRVWLESVRKIKEVVTKRE
jgi:hypothetical protein